MEIQVRDNVGQIRKGNKKSKVTLGSPSANRASGSQAGSKLPSQTRKDQNKAAHFEENGRMMMMSVETDKADEEASSDEDDRMSLEDSFIPDYEMQDSSDEEYVPEVIIQKIAL